MRSPTRREWALLALAPVVILLAAGFDRDDAGSAVTIAEAAKPAVATTETRAAAEAGELDVARLQRDAAVPDADNVFESKSWYVPPPPPPPAMPVAPPAPSAPPLPFTYLGQYQGEGKSVIFLVRGDRVLAVGAGDVIEGTYRVDGISGSSLGLTYLPLNIRQTLDIGSMG